jgi:hypothetical protein
MPDYRIQLAPTPAFAEAYQRGVGFRNEQEAIRQQQEELQRQLAARDQLATAFQGYQPGQAIPSAAFPAMATLAPQAVMPMAETSEQMAVRAAEQAREERKRGMMGEAYDTGQFEPLRQEFPVEGMAYQQALTAEKQAEIKHGATMAKFGLNYLQNTPPNELNQNIVYGLAASMSDTEEEVNRYMSSPAGLAALRADMEKAYGMGAFALAHTEQQKAASPMGKVMQDYGAGLIATEDLPRALDAAAKGSGITIDLGTDAGRKKAYEAGASATIGIVRGGYDKLINAPGMITAMQQAHNLIDSGAMTGTGAEWRLDVKKAMKFMGIDVSDEEISSTETLASVLKDRVAASLKMTFGAQLSEGERAYLESAMGKIGTDPNALKDILTFYEQKARDSVKTHNEMAEAVSEFTLVPLTVTLPPEKKAKARKEPETQEELPSPESYPVGTRAEQDGMTMEVIEYEGRKVWMRR